MPLPNRNNDTIQEEISNHQYGNEDVSEKSRQAYDDDQESEIMGFTGAKNTKIFRFQTKFNRPFFEGEGPRDANFSQNYN